jgi:probable aminopeptidase NPEPL1
VLCGAEALLEEKAAAVLQKVLPQEVSVPSYLKSLLRKPCSAFRGNVCSTLLPLGSEGENFARVSLLCVPSVASRHNSPTRPDVVFDKLPGLLTSENEQVEGALTMTLVQLVFVLAPGNDKFSEENSAASFSAALARSLPLYSRKASANDAEQVVVQVSFFSAARDAFCWSQEKDTTFLRQLSVSAEAVRQAASLVDQPCNECHTDGMVERAKRLVEEMEHDSNVEGTVSLVKCCVGEDLAKEGFGGIYGVGKAASRPPALVVLKYEPKSGSGGSVAWVGKGIVYDTGGLSLKTPVGMPGMKRDMGGAAAILEAFRATCLLGSSKTVYAVLCLAENAIGPLAARPDDIHTMYSGLTVEINNTDAEGRLVLGDGVAYVSKHLGVDVILDMCTLTGAQGISTGEIHAAIVCNQDEIEQSAVLAGKKTGDLCHPLLYCPELFMNEFRSSVADMKNSVANRANAQSSCAAQFIAAHMKEYTNTWIHVDMAYPVSKGERATGYGVMLLLQLFGILQDRPASL